MSYFSYTPRVAKADGSYDYLLCDGSIVNTLSSVMLSATWNGSGPYTQTVQVLGAGANSRIDLQPDATVIQQMLDDNVSALYIENNNGVFTAYAVGEKPTVALTIQVSITEMQQQPTV